MLSGPELSAISPLICTGFQVRFRRQHLAPTAYRSKESPHASSNRSGSKSTMKLNPSQREVSTATRKGFVIVPSALQQLV